MAHILRRSRFLIFVVILLALGACSKLDVEQVGICESLLPAMESKMAAVTVLEPETDPARDNAILLRYRVATKNKAEEHWISCRFACSGFDVARRNLIGVVTDRAGALTDVQLFMLRKFWVGRFESQAGVQSAAMPEKPSALLHLAYFLQQAVNALTVGGVYGLLAISYTLVFAIIARINLAFGEITMIGAYGTVLTIYVLTSVSGAGVLPALLIATIFAMTVAALYAWLTERLVFRPLAGQRSQAILIATIGLAIFLQEAMRLLHGAGDRWLQPVLNAPHIIAEGGGFAVVITTAKLVIVAVVLGLYAVLYGLVEKGRFGRTWRACADDRGMASLCGINVRRTIAVTFLLSGAYAAIAGTIIAIHYGGVSFHMGTVLGFKALTAAVVGGIGSIPGAMLGGLLVAFVETFWSGYLTAAYRDIAVFGLLALALIFRPHGLIGRPRLRRLDQP